MKNLRVEVLRGENIESLHEVIVVAVDPSGARKAQFGDWQNLPAVFPRSAIKPLQSLLLLESGAYQKFALSGEHLALASASHMGEEFHLLAVQEWLKKMQLPESALACGSHWPLDKESFHVAVKNFSQPLALMNNCSGKHIGFLASCLAKSWELQNYVLWEHPLQMELRKILSPIFGLDLNSAPWGIDGCSIPTIAVPLESLAYSMCFFGGHSSEAKLISQAMWDHPHLVAGKLSPVSQWLREGRNQFLVKNGAEGVYAGYDFQNNFGFALKALDGSSRASEAAMDYLLKLWGHKLNPIELKIKNWVGTSVGQIRIKI